MKPEPELDTVKWSLCTDNAQIHWPPHRVSTDMREEEGVYTYTGFCAQELILI